MASKLVERLSFRLHPDRGRKPLAGADRNLMQRNSRDLPQSGVRPQIDTRRALIHCGKDCFPNFRAFQQPPSLLVSGFCRVARAGGGLRCVQVHQKFEHEKLLPLREQFKSTFDWLFKPTVTNI
jgi:hypothetical protein